MIGIFITLQVVISALYWLIIQYNESPAIQYGYILVVIALCISYFILEKRRRLDIVRRAEELFDGKYSGITSEDELSSLERRIVCLSRNSAAAETKIKDSYIKIAGLISDISHQCKTPLSSVLLYSEMPPCVDNSRAIHNEACKLSFLLDALTKLSRCESGLIDNNLRTAEYSVNRLVCEAVNGVLPSARNHNIDIVCDIPEDIKVTCDFRWTVEAVFNIIDNAVKYSPVDSGISVAVCEYDFFARIDISDSGPGIPEEEQTEIWKRFYRGKNAGGSDGVGIGLYLTRLILLGEGSRVSVKSSFGHGSVFSIFLPLSCKDGRKVTKP